MKRNRVVIHQPDFMPYLGYFHRLLQCDQFIVLDHVQFSRGGWHNRDKIKTRQGERWLTIPVVKSGMSFTPLSETHIKVTEDWQERHLCQIAEAYREAPHFAETFAGLEALYSSTDRRLVDFNMRCLRWLMEEFDVEVPMVFSTDLGPQGKSNELLVHLLKQVGATEYLSGVGARAYFEAEVFEAAGIPVRWQELDHPIYPQLHGPFVPYLSSLDLLMNCGRTESRRILRECL